MQLAKLKMKDFFEMQNDAKIRKWIRKLFASLVLIHIQSLFHSLTATQALQILSWLQPSRTNGGFLRRQLVHDLDGVHLVHTDLATFLTFVLPAIEFESYVLLFLGLLTEAFRKVGPIFQNALPC